MNGPRAPGWPHFADDEIAAVDAVLRSGKVNYWTGDQGRLFEQEFAAYVGVEHGIALANGTLALELALRAIGIGPGDEVIVTPTHFHRDQPAASSTCGAKPVFADIDPRQPEHHGRPRSRTQLSPRTRAIIAVHLAGWPCDMDPILATLAASPRSASCHRRLRTGAWRPLSRPSGRLARRRSPRSRSVRTRS
jgi:dTDP-4-amino-4,6-dideoxygalactose transaminase